MDFKRRDNENYYQYIWRLDNLIQSGKYKNWKKNSKGQNESN